MALATVAKRQKPSSRSSPVKARSAVFPRRPSGSKSGAKTVEVPLFVPDEEVDFVPQVTNESEGDEWEDFGGELEEDVQMSIAIAESLELQHQSRRVPDTRPPAQISALETPIKASQRTDMNNREKAVGGDEDEFTSPSRLATQLSIAGARKPLSTRIPSDSVRGTAPSVISTASISQKKSSQSLVTMSILDQPPANLGQSDSDTGDKGESDEDDDMEEVSIPQATGNRSHTPVTEPALGSPELLVNPELVPVTDHAETPLAIGVEDVVAKGFAEFQKIFAEKRRRSQVGNVEVQEEIRQAREVLRAESPGLEYADGQVGVIEVQEKVKEAIEVRPSPPQYDEDEDMEEVEVVAAPPSVPFRVPHSSVQFQPPPSLLGVTGSLSPKRVGNSADEEDEEDAPISDWSRSPSPRPRPPPADEAGPSTSAPTLDLSRGLLDPDDSFDRGPSGEQDQEHEDFDAAHEMDADAEAGEFARWMSQVKGRNLDDVRKEIEQEIKGLRKEQKAAMRDSEDITSQMIAQIMVGLRQILYRLSLSFWIWIWIYR